MGGRIRGVTPVRMHCHGVYVTLYGIQQQRRDIIELDRYANLSPLRQPPSPIPLVSSVQGRYAAGLLNA